MNRATLFSVAGASLLGLLLIAAAASYLAPSSSKGSLSDSRDGVSTATFVSLYSTTNTLPCNDTSPLSLGDLNLFENGSGFFLFSSWRSCGPEVDFLVTGRDMLVNITAKGQTMNYTGYVGSGLESAAGPSEFGNVTQPFHFSSPVNSTGVTAILSSGTLTAINPSTGVALSPPQGFSEFSTIAYPTTGSSLTTSSSGVSTSNQNSTS